MDQGLNIKVVITFFLTLKHFSGQEEMLQIEILRGCILMDEMYYIVLDKNIFQAVNAFVPENNVDILVLTTLVAILRRTLW